MQETRDGVSGIAGSQLYLMILPNTSNGAHFVAKSS